MKKREILSTNAVLFALSVLALSLVRVSAVPESPYIMIVPEKTVDYTRVIGSTYTVSVITDYGESDVWMWQFGLSFNSSVLNGTGVTNGDLITTSKDPSAVFIPGAFNNTEGRLYQTTAYFDPAYYDPPEYRTTSGPGALAVVSFKVVGYGSTDITFVKKETELDGAIGSYPYPVIDMDGGLGGIGNGFFSNVIIGDIDRDRDVDGVDFGIFAPSYGSLIGQPRYNPRCDLDNDGDVDGVDFGLFAPNYGKSV